MAWFWKREKANASPILVFNYGDLLTLLSAADCAVQMRTEKALEELDAALEPYNDLMPWRKGS